MPAVFPSASSRTLPTDPRELAGLLARTPPDVLRDGYVRLTVRDGDVFLFLVQGKAHGAGKLEDDRFGPIKFAEFFEYARIATRAELCATDLPLLLCMEVLFRKAPAAQIPSTLVKGEELLVAMQETGKDAVLVIRNGDARSLVFCKAGEPTSLYPASGQTFPDGRSVADQVVEYVLAHKNLTLDLYDEIRLPAASGAGKPFESYLQEIAMRPASAPSMVAPPQYTIVVRLGSRVVFRLPATSDSISIGRGDDNDLVLDNLLVSRKHAIINKTGNGWTIEDLGSENQLLVYGQKTRKTELTPGLEVGIGKYIIVLSRYQSSDNVRMPTPTPISTGGSVKHEETIIMSGPGSAAAIEHNGTRHPVRGLFFDIGRAPGAHLKISGLFIAPIHVRIARDRDGSHRIEHVAGLRALRLNGKKVVEAPIKSGDQFSIAGHNMKFVMPGAQSGSSTRLGPR